METVKGSDIKPGQSIKSGNRWYTVEQIGVGDGQTREATARDAKGGRWRLIVTASDDYPVRPARPTRPRKITRGMASRLVAVIAELQECEDCTGGLSRALEDARAGISPWYDTEGR